MRILKLFKKYFPPTAINYLTLTLFPSCNKNESNHHQRGTKVVFLSVSPWFQISPQSWAPQNSHQEGWTKVEEWILNQHQPLQNPWVLIGRNLRSLSKALSEYIFPFLGSRIRGLPSENTKTRYYLIKIEKKLKSQDKEIFSLTKQLHFNELQLTEDVLTLHDMINEKDTIH